MERMNSNKILLCEILLLILPLTVQIYNIVAEKLGMPPLPGNLVTLILLLAASLFVYNRHKNTILFTTYKYAVAFSCLSLATIFLNSNLGFENSVRGICSVIFVPLAFAVGSLICSEMMRCNKSYWYNLILLLPIFSIAPMMQSILMFIGGTEFGRDSVLAISVFLPLVLMLKGKYTKLTLLTVILYWSVISAKRTAVLCAALALLFFFLSEILSFAAKRTYTFMAILIILFVAGFVSYSKYPEFASQVDIVIERFDNAEDNESNRERTEMYQGTLNAYDSSSLLERLFGHGYKATEKDLYGRPTHNDLLEILYDYGVVALLLYVIFLFSLLYGGIKAFIINKANVYLLFAVCNFLLLSMMNCMITNPVFVFVNLFCIGYSVRYTKESIISNS